jgi:hypothetical protein
VGDKSLFIIGDSISIHYKPYLNKSVRDKFCCQREDQNDKFTKDPDITVDYNAGDSNMVLKYILEEHTKGIRYDVLLLNCGLHDIRVDREFLRINVDKGQYKENLNKIVELALKSSNKVIWVNTTPVIDEIHNRREFGFLRYNKDVLLYNEIAEKIMKNHRVPCIDLYAFTKSLGDDVYYDHVHFKEEIRVMQGTFIASNLQCLLWED